MEKEITRARNRMVTMAITSKVIQATKVSKANIKVDGSKAITKMDTKAIKRRSVSSMLESSMPSLCLFICAT